jgi:FlaA1/EpsC-like NDP-sugar epimerase
MESFYIQQCLPRKLKLNQEYAQRANLLTDMWIVLQTVCPYWFGVLAVYAMILAASLWLSFALVNDSAVTDWSGGLLGGQAIIIALQLACLLSRRHCKGLLCYFGLPEVRQIGMGLGLAALVLLGVSTITTPSWPPRNIILINLCLSLLFLGGFRLLMRLWRERAAGPASTTAPMRVGIVGAGSLGIQLARSLNVEKRFGRTAVAFFDDDVSKWQKRIHEIPVVGMPECVLQGWADRLDEVAIAMPNASPSRIHEISQLFQKTKLRVYNVEWPVAAWGHSETRSNLAPA